MLPQVRPAAWHVEVLRHLCAGLHDDGVGLVHSVHALGQTDLLVLGHPVAETRPETLVEARLAHLVVEQLEYHDVEGVLCLAHFGSRGRRRSAAAEAACAEGIHEKR